MYVYGLNVNVKCKNESLARRRRVQFPFLLEMFVPTAAAAPAKPHVQNTKCTFGTLCGDYPSAFRPAFTISQKPIALANQHQSSAADECEKNKCRNYCSGRAQKTTQIEMQPCYPSPPLPPKLKKTKLAC